MALTKFTEDVQNIQALSDRPNSTDGLTADQLKAKYDKAGEDIKDYINNTLTSELDTDFITDSDSRLTDSRACNNTFDDAGISRSNLELTDPATAQFGSGAGNVCEGNDSRLTDSRTCNNNFDNEATSRSNLDVYSKSEGDSRYLLESNNLSDLENNVTARSNLGVVKVTRSSTAPLSPAVGDFWVDTSA